MYEEFPKNGSVDLQNLGREEDFDFLKNNYQGYLELGGVINEEDYRNIIEGMSGTGMFNRNNPESKSRIAQAESIADYAKIKLSNSEGAFDRRIILYVVLRGDARLNKAEYHHIQIDSQMFREALRILGDTDALGKLKEAYHSSRPSGTSCSLCGQIGDSENCP